LASAEQFCRFAICNFLLAYQVYELDSLHFGGDFLFAKPGRAKTSSGSVR